VGNVLSPPPPQVNGGELRAVVRTNMPLLNESSTPGYALRPRPDDSEFLHAKLER
jgi:hypothetical protein